MSTPPFSTIFGSIEAFSGVLSLMSMLEGKYENDGNQNPIYVGLSPIPNADPAAAVWFIQMLVYDGNAVIGKRLPDEGVKFSYVWNDRADYFS